MKSTPRITTVLVGLLSGLALPAVAHANAGGKLLIALYAAPLVLPALGLFAALIGLPLSSSRRLWWFLCVLLGLNAAVLGALVSQAEGLVVEALFVVGQLALASAMLFTTVADPPVAKLRLVMRRVPSVAAFGILPAVLSWLLAR